MNKLNITVTTILLVACCAFSPIVWAVSPPPDGGYPNGNTAEGDSALQLLTSGANNTAVGAGALYSNTNGNGNTATGFQTLNSNSSGSGNTANGISALHVNHAGNQNTAIGAGALYSNDGADNTAVGFEALLNNRTGTQNTASGSLSLFNNNGTNNTADGFQALLDNTGNNNIAIGSNAGKNLTTGDNNIDIGALGVAGDSDTIRIGKRTVQKNAYIQGIRGATVASGLTVIVGTDGHLGTTASSARFKEEIKPMDNASEAILALKPVTFRYKKALDPEGIPQFGLVAEEVAKVNPDLVARDEKGEIYTVRYDAVNAMLLNEFLKQHRTVEEQQKEIDALSLQLKEQRALIQKVSAQLETSRSAPQMVLNN